MSNLDFLYNPRSVAVIGASRHPEKLGYMVLNNIKKYGFKGKIYPINPEANKILGLECHKSVLDIGGNIDLAVITVPANFVLDVLEECGKKAVKAAIIITAGFKEIGGEGVEAEEKIKNIASEYNIRVLGPNCLGLIDTYANLNASFAESMPKKWDIGLFSQSGAMCTAILDWANANGIGFSKFVSLGNKADITECDLIESWIKDDKVDVVLGYLEGISDGEKFLDLAKKLTLKKPFVVIKSGSSDEGVRAISSHTGSLAGFDEATEAAFRKSGIIRAKTIEDLFDASKIFSLSNLPKGGRVAIITNAGGPSVMATDAVDESKVLSMAPLSKKSEIILSKILPKASNVKNPVDVIGDAKTERYEDAIKAAIDDKNIDVVLVILTPQVMTEVEKTAEMISRLKQRSKKPIVACFMGGLRIESGINILEKGKVPAYLYPERAVKSIEYLVTHALNLKEKEGKQKKIDFDKETVRKIIASTRGDFTDVDVFQILNAYGIASIKSVSARGLEGVKRAALEVGYPVVIKIASPDILHKADIGGVKTNIKTQGELVVAYSEMIKNINQKAPNARIKGITVSRMRESGQEVIIGGKRDDIFGPMIMFGLGGLYVEVLKDVIFEICPITKEIAREMIMKIKTVGLLTGFRGQGVYDTEAIADAIVRVSNLLVDFPEIKELDINPLRVHKKGEGVEALDAKIISTKFSEAPVASEAVG